MKKSISLTLILLAMLFVSNSRAQDPQAWKNAARENLFERYKLELQHQGNNPARMSNLNDLDIKAMLATPEPNDDIRATHLTLEQAQEVFDHAFDHPVVGASALSKYDPQLVMGFCFGRATFVHLELLRRGVHKDSIRKVYVVGPMQTGDIFWQFHVATSVRGESGQWYTIDPLFAPSAMPLESWMSTVKETSIDGTVRFYPTHASKLGPSAFEYNKLPVGGVNDPIYNKYFEDMFKTFKTEPVVKSYKKNQKPVVSPEAVIAEEAEILKEEQLH